jgi:hypothetical protein
MTSQQIRPDQAVVVLNLSVTSLKGTNQQIDQVCIHSRAANESSRAELGLTQARLMKIRVESS